ncbi:MAG: TetR/AcrR family transcriptional regulator [Lautropia sp.]
MARGRSPLYGDQHDAILRAAARLFALRGYAGTSMNEIAAESRLSKAALYHYYRDKYALLVQIAEGHVDRLASIAGEVDGAIDPAAPAAPQDRMRALIRRIIAEYADAQDAHRVLTSDVRFLEADDRARILRKEREVVDAFAAAIRAWQPAQHDAGLTTPLTMLLFGMINWMFTWMKPDGPLTHEMMGSIVADLFAGGVPAVCVPPATATRRAPRRVRSRSPAVDPATGAARAARGRRDA